jgi:hypothetical protein
MEKTRKRNFCFVINGYKNRPDTLEILRNVTAVKYIGWAEEIGEYTGNAHVQGLVSFEEKHTLENAGKKLGGHANCRFMNGTFQEARDYYAIPSEKKPGPIVGLVEIGTLPMDQDKKGEAGKAAYQEMWDLAEKGEIDKIPAKVRFTQIKTIDNIHQRALKKVKLENSTI